MKTLGDSHLIERGNSLKNNNIFLRIKQFNQENKCNLYKKTIFLYRIAVALRMECVDLSINEGMDELQNIVALHMECVDLSFLLCFYFYNFSVSHSTWSAWI